MKKTFGSHYLLKNSITYTCTVNATPKAVLAILDESFFENRCVAQIFEYL